jgi:hypothetical protein
MPIRESDTCLLRPLGRLDNGGKGVGPGRVLCAISMRWERDKEMGTVEVLYDSTCAHGVVGQVETQNSHVLDYIRQIGRVV